MLLYSFLSHKLRVSAKWVKCQPQDHDLNFAKSEAELLGHGSIFVASNNNTGMME
jgi:hypothetical protein